MPDQLNRLCRKCEIVFSSRWCRVWHDDDESSDEECDCDSSQDEDVSSASPRRVFQRPTWPLKEEPLHGTPPHHTILGLQESALSCDICFLLHDQVGRKLVKEGARLKTTSVDSLVGYLVPYRSRKLGGEMKNRVNLKCRYFVDGVLHKNGPKITSSIDLYQFQGQVTDIIQPHQEPHTQWDPVVRCGAQIQKWIDACEVDHLECQSLVARMHPRTDLPTRLLHICLHDNLPKISLLNTSGLDPEVRYATLSHRWGNTQTLKLLQSNVSLLQEDISFWSLPRTFQDAIRLCLSVDVQYIWIDSLCIIQDSREDWEHEANRMSDVYSRSWLSIAATSANDGHGGLFRDTKFLRSPLVHASWTGSDLLSGALVAVDPHAWNTRVEDAPLNTRAWVLQERVLAPRTVHFASDQMWWSCVSVPAACEQMPTGAYLPKHANSPTTGLLWKPPSANADDWHSNWLKVIEIYTSTQITQVFDRPIALAGMAEATARMHGIAGDDYLAGIWREHVLCSLLWHTADASTRPPTRGTPTWSWLSVEGQVYFASSNTVERLTHSPLVSCIDIQTERGESPFGLVSGGCVTLKGPVVPIFRTNMWESYPERGFENSIGTFQPEDLVILDRDLDRIRWQDRFFVFGEYLDDKLEPRRWPEAGKELYFACFSLEPREAEKIVDGLILDRCDGFDANEPKYVRVGSMRLFFQGPCEEYFQKYMQTYYIY